MKLPSSYVCELTPPQIATLREILADKGWVFSDAPYAHWKAVSGKTTVAVYHSGKCCVQGKGTPDLVQFILEPEILKQARFGYETELTVIEHPEMFSPHAGIDESGKGDYFGPLVIAAAYVEEEAARNYLTYGVADSKTIKSDKRILDLAEKIRREPGGAWSVIAIGPETYNRLYLTLGNVNRMLAWGHARALENLLEKKPACPRAISDQFGSKEIVTRALMAKGRQVVLEQRHKAEADVAVAAASILARAEFITRLEQLGQKYEIKLPRGAGPAVDAVAKAVAERGGPNLLKSIAKLHFRTTGRATGEPTE